MRDNPYFRDLTSTPLMGKFRLLATASGAAMLIAAQAASAQTQTSSPTADTAASAQEAADAPTTPVPPPSIEAAAPSLGRATPEAAAEAGEGGGEIVVTGSLISRPDYKANSPIVSVTQEALQATGQVTVERALSQLPQFTGSFGQSNTGSTGTGLNGGQSYASIRGLGPKRTLILLDGKRLQPSNPNGSIDLNTIPEALIGNVEVITGGASTVYGSDATAGVVNFRLRRDFAGLTVNGQYGITNYGDGQTYRANATAGGKFDDGRGRAVLSIDYSGRTRAKRNDRPWYSDRLPQTGNAASYHGSAVFTAPNLPTLASVNTVLSRYGVGPLRTSNGSTTYSGGAQIGFNTDGTIFTANGVPALNFREPETNDAYLVDSGNTIYGPGKQMKFGFDNNDAQTDLSRWGAFGRFDYELGDNINAFGQFTYTKYKQGSIVNTTLSNNVYLQSVPYNNPFLPADFRAILASRPQPTADFQFHKAFNAIGNRFQGFEYDVYQFMGGFDGKLNIGDWTWQAYVSTSKAEFNNSQSGGISRTRLNTLVYAADGGRSICEGGLNLFGNYAISDSCANYIKRDTLNTTVLKQRVAEGTIQGGLVDLPAGTMRFALGAGYRKNSFDYDSDDALDQPDGTSDIIGFSVLRSSGGSVNVKELFAELFVPILKDIPFIQEFNIDLGYRYSDYNSVGSVNTYKIDGEWQIVDPLRLRGGYNRAIRAPSVGELFAPISTGSVGIGTAGANTDAGDPCDFRSRSRNGPNKARVEALCLAQGIAPATLSSFVGTSQVFPLTGGNPNLDEETSDTYSVGAVLSSPFSSPVLSGMQLSVDYYNIKIRDAIGTLGIVQSVQNCFNITGINPNFDPNNSYCALLARSPQGPLEPPTNQPLLNLGKFVVSGVDVQFDWRLRFEDMGVGIPGQLTYRSVISYLDKFKVQQLPGGPFTDYAGFINYSIEADGSSGLAHPEWKANTSLTYSNEDITVGLTWRFTDSMINATATTSRVKAYNVFDLNASYRMPGDASIRIGVTNLFNKAPPSYGPNPETYDANTYDVVGRYFFTSITKKF